MIACIIIMLINFALLVLILGTAKDEKDTDAGCLPFVVFMVTLIFTIFSCSNARSNKMLYNDMAKNPQCYSINDLKEAHKDIIRLKSRQGRWTSFYNGYEFPEINVDVMSEVNNTIHIVK